MFSTILNPWLIFAAFVLQMLFDKPYRITHPVVIIGKGLDVLERISRRWHEHGIMGLGRFRWRISLNTAGKWSLLVAMFCTANVVYWLCALPFIGLVVAMLFSAMGLALGNLLYEVKKAANIIKAADIIKDSKNSSLDDSHAGCTPDDTHDDANSTANLDQARQAVGMLVSRDTSELDQDQLRRALAETVAENFNDGFVAPLFWLTLTGPVGLWVYKCVSTVDSMWGYRNERYEDFGKAGARLDDMLAYIPARLSAALLWMAGPLVLCGAWPWIFKRIQADAKTMESPNAGWPMATAAWMHGVPMGGPTPYFGVMKDKPVLGPKPSGEASGEVFGEQAPEPSGVWTHAPSGVWTHAPSGVWTHDRLEKLCRHVKWAGIVGGALALGFAVLVRMIF
ncbi:MAG: CobD/CbiB family cobalamin biosynthesis protein [Pseudomonadota bacterium]